ncbi:MAG TPA: [protein-PII] uridylyltransferase, partial [Polyangiales bacterium]|nr:[protein-PII] uridylyltransferase [Polyangiales bacterium]
MEEFETASDDEAISSARKSSLRELVVDHRDELLDMFTVPGASGLELARRHAAIMDGLLVKAYDEAIAKAGRRIARTPFTMTAVGSYGRGWLGWKSDLELRFITSVSPDKIRSIVNTIVDSLRSGGIEVSHQIASVTDMPSAAALDMHVATALLDGRVLAGDRALFDSSRERAYASVFSAAQLPRFFAQLEAEADARHKRLGGSIYMLEPDVKSGMGGTRDLDIASWAAKARWKTSDPSELQRLGVLTARAVEDVEAATEFMWTLRNRLHLRMGRRSDQLSFSEQETIARALEYPGSTSENAGAPRVNPSVEALMADYYRHARNVLRISDQVVHRAKSNGALTAPRELDAGMSEWDGCLGLRAPAQLASDPTLALRLYASAVERNMPLLSETRATIAELAQNVEWCSALRASREANALFVQLASDLRKAPFRSGSIVNELHDVGLLVAMIPEFAPLVGRVHREATHVYTVNAHSLVAVERLRALLRGELAQQHPNAHRWASQVTRPHVLCLATLLHDLGRVTPIAGQVQRGAEMARAIFARLGFSQDDNAAACELIRNQLKMYLAAVRRDLDDPATLAEFTREGQSLEGLRDLYLLTVVCISTISPSSMTKWKAGMLDALFSASEAQLRGEAQDDPGRVSRTCMQFKQAWADQGDAAFLDEFIDSMPDRYLSMHSAAEIAAHARVAQ